MNTLKLSALIATLALKRQRGVSVCNGPVKAAGRPWFSVKNDAAAPHAEILIYDEIGSDWWDGSGVNAQKFAEQLKAIPPDREIIVGINSPGGNVWDGLAIYQQLKARRAKVVTRIDGIALSIASVIALAGREVRMPKAALFMVHDPSTIAVGNSREMRKVAETLDKHRDAIAATYEEKTRKDRDELNTAMAEETWFTGDEAKAYGFVDVVTDDAPVANSFDLSSFRRVPEALNRKAPQNPAVRNGGPIQQIMNRQEIIAMLNQLGVTFDNNATDEQLSALLKSSIRNGPSPAPAPAPAPAAAAPAAAPAADPNAARIANLEARYESERRTRIEAEIDNAIADRRIVAAQRENWVRRAIADETVLADIKAMPVMTPPAAEGVTLEITAESLADIDAHIVRASKEVSASFLRGNDVKMDAFRASGLAIGNAYHKNRDRLLPVLNANTVSADLKRQAILQEGLRAFAVRLLPLRAFSTVHEMVPLEGTDEVVVPFYSLHAVASKAFVPATGYEFDSSVTGSRKVTIDQRQYQGLSLTSAELRRQPFLNIMKNLVMAGERLADDVFATICGVITAANFGAPVYANAASAFDSDEVSNIRTACNQSHWSKSGRSLILDSEFDGALLKDNSVKAALNFGSTDPIQLGEIRNLLGFAYFETPSIPDNGEFLAGMAVHPSAIVAATAPILPDEDVRAQLSRYLVIVDPKLGIAIEARSFGNAQMDTGYHTLECNFGYDVGDAAALKRIVTQA